MTTYYNSYLGTRDLGSSTQTVSSQGRVVFSIENSTLKIYYPNKTVETVSIAGTYPIYAQPNSPARNTSGDTFLIRGTNNKVYVLSGDKDMVASYPTLRLNYYPEAEGRITYGTLGWPQGSLTDSGILFSRASDPNPAPAPQPVPITGKVILYQNGSAVSGADTIPL
ncbi:hypothetical protein [Asaia krungthepensis]|uniref:Uncharacterized protein n=1 Tax=Asaia krungthepensis NRIC 0535 TaxID=1307925 RepID=A0ABQ0Q5Q8_9PROT|nr:hypothetical protein [Asaia krungthepensis]GBQ92669.1 hypothetical protein AA0535_2621 [Asaia krungthepensis NRIC 0535]